MPRLLRTGRPRVGRALLHHRLHLDRAGHLVGVGAVDIAAPPTYEHRTARAGLCWSISQVGPQSSCRRPRRVPDHRRLPAPGNQVLGVVGEAEGAERLCRANPERSEQGHVTGSRCSDSFLPVSCSPRILAPYGLVVGHRLQVVGPHESAMPSLPLHSRHRASAGCSWGPSTSRA
jgi:hypothetical protein